MPSGLLAFAVACAFSGAVLYINLVEQPSRLALRSRAAAQEWTVSNRRGSVMLALMAVISGLLGYAECIHTGDLRWLVGCTIIVSTWPYAYFVMTPVTIWLAGMRQTAPPSAIRELVQDWGLLEWGEAAIGVSAVLTFGWPIVLPP